MFELKFFVALTVLSSACLIGLGQGRPYLLSSSYGYHPAAFFNLYPSDNSPHGVFQHLTNLDKLIADAFYLPVGRVLGGADFMGTMS